MYITQLRWRDATYHIASNKAAVPKASLCVHCGQSAGELHRQSCLHNQLTVGDEIASTDKRLRVHSTLRVHAHGCE